MSIFHDFIIHNNGKESPDFLNLIITSFLSIVTVIVTLYIAKNQIKLQSTIAQNQSKIQKEISNKQTDLQQKLLDKQQKFQDKIADMQRQHEINISKDNEKHIEKLQKQQLNAHIITTQRLEWMNKVRDLTGEILKSRRLCIKNIKVGMSNNTRNVNILKNKDASQNYQNMREIGLEFDLYFSPYKINEETNEIEKNNENIEIIKKRMKMTDTLLPLLNSKNQSEYNKHYKIHSDASIKFQHAIRLYLKKEWDKAKNFDTQ